MPLMTDDQKKQFLNFNVGHLLTIVSMIGAVAVTYWNFSTHTLQVINDLQSRVSYLERSDAQQQLLMNRVTIVETQISSLSNQMVSVMTLNSRTVDNLGAIREDIAGIKATLNAINAK